MAMVGWHRNLLVFSNFLIFEKISCFQLDIPEKPRIICVEELIITIYNARCYSMTQTEYDTL